MSGERVIVIGAGPAGLTAAYELDRCRADFTILEATGDVGGISRTVCYKGYRFDIGGHRFYSKSQEVENLWTAILGNRMLQRKRLSRIYYNKRFFKYPLEPFDTLAKLGPLTALGCLASFAAARLRPVREPRSFEDWTVNAFGRRLFDIFFKTYTEKVWGVPCSQISADWAAQRIKDLSMTTLLRSMIGRVAGRRRGKVIKTLIDCFRYPRLGPGELWEQLAADLGERGHPVVLNAAVTAIERAPNGELTISTADGRRHMATAIISSMPLRSLVAAMTPAPPPEVKRAAESLRYRDFVIVMLIVEQAYVFDDQWIYIHDPNLKLGRIQNFKNWSAEMVPDERYTSLGLEYFCFDGDGLWSATDTELIALGRSELAKLGLVDQSKVIDGTVVRQRLAYPVYDQQYRAHVDIIRAWQRDAIPEIQLVGRNGMHRYNNQDHAMMTGLLAARNILERRTYDLWAVNADAIYQESVYEHDTDDVAGRLVPLPLEAAMPASGNGPTKKHKKQDNTR